MLFFLCVYLTFSLLRLYIYRPVCSLPNFGNYKLIYYAVYCRGLTYYHVLLIFCEKEEKQTGWKTIFCGLSLIHHHVWMKQNRIVLWGATGLFRPNIGSGWIIQLVVIRRYHGRMSCPGSRRFIVRCWAIKHKPFKYTMPIRNQHKILIEKRAWLFSERDELKISNQNISKAGHIKQFSKLKMTITSYQDI